MNAHAALALCLALPGVRSVLDVGCGNGEHAARFRAANKHVVTVAATPPADYVCDYITGPSYGEPFDLVWASHVLEHQRNVGNCIDRLIRDCKPGGWIAITVPPMKDEVVGGHLALFNAGTLLYNLVAAGLDASGASVITDGYDVSVVVQNRCIALPALAHDRGDIELLADRFPVSAQQGFDGRIKRANWSDRSWH